MRICVCWMDQHDLSGKPQSILRSIFYKNSVLKKCMDVDPKRGHSKYKTGLFWILQKSFTDSDPLSDFELIFRTYDIESAWIIQFGMFFHVTNIFWFIFIVTDLKRFGTFFFVSSAIEGATGGVGGFFIYFVSWL